MLADLQSALVGDGSCSEEDFDEHGRYISTDSDTVWESLFYLIDGRVLDGEQLGVDRPALERLVIEAEVSAVALEAFDVAQRDAQAQLDRMKAMFRTELAARGEGAVIDRLNRTARRRQAYLPSRVWDAFFDAADDYKRQPSGLLSGPVGEWVEALRGQRPRESRPRASRSSRSRGSPSRSSSDDPDLADLLRRCPRCGSLARPLLPSALWTCDRCADALLEQAVQHNLERVFAEADRILRGASA